VVEVEEAAVLDLEVADQADGARQDEDRDQDP
jgi:hypothetical protein